MATVVSVTLVKRFTYRGDSSEEWSNKYYLTGSVPSDAAAWKALADALIVVEKPLYTSGTAVVQAYGYDSDAETPTSVWGYDYLAASASVPGTHTIGGVKMAGDQAACVWWRTSRLTSPGGKPIYLRKYFHDGDIATGGGDDLTSGYATALNTFGTKLMDGTFLDARTIRSRLNSETITLRGHVPYVTTRTLKRRGKRPGG